MPKAFSEMHIVVTRFVEGEEEKPASVQNPNEMDFEASKIGFHWCIEYP